MSDFWNGERLSSLALVLDAIAILGWVAAGQSWFGIEGVVVLLGMAPFAVILGVGSLLRPPVARQTTLKGVVAISLGLILTGVGMFLTVWGG